MWFLLAALLDFPAGNLSIEVGFNWRHVIFGTIAESLFNEDYQEANAFQALNRHGHAEPQGRCTAQLMRGFQPPALLEDTESTEA